MLESVITYIITTLIGIAIGFLGTKFKKNKKRAWNMN